MRGISFDKFEISSYKFISTRYDKRYIYIYILRWNIIQKSIGVAWNEGPYKLIGQLIDLNLAKT